MTLTPVRVTGKYVSADGLSGVEPRRLGATPPTLLPGERNLYPVWAKLKGDGEFLLPLFADTATPLVYSLQETLGASARTLSVTIPAGASGELTLKDLSGYTQPAGAVLGARGGALSLATLNATLGAQAADGASALRMELAKVLVAEDKLVTYAADHGVVGDGVADDGPSMNTFLAFAATWGLRAQLTAGSTIRTATVAIAPPSGTRMDGNGATIVNARPGTGSVAVEILGKAGVALWDLKVDGAKASFAAATEWRHNIRISNSSKVLLRDVNSFDAKGDGIYVGDNLAGMSQNIQLDNVTCDRSHRNGLSIVACRDLYAFGCRFINSSGTNPQCGLDIEPNTDTDVVSELKFVGCTFTGNGHAGMTVNCPDTATAVQGGFEFIGCTFADNSQDGISLRGCTDLRIIGGTISGNVNNGLLSTSSSVGTITEYMRLSDVEIRNNGLCGISAVQTFERSSIIGCTVRDNSQAAPGTLDGISIIPSGVTTGAGIRLIGNTMGGASQRYGLRTGSQVTGLYLLGNDYPANTTGPRSLSDASTSRVDMDFTTTLLSLPGSMRLTADASLVTYGVRVTGDTQDRWAMRSEGKQHWGPGNAAFDVDLSRIAANVLGLGTNDAFMTGKAVTASRPTAASVGQGGQFFDTTLNTPIWSDGTLWREPVMKPTAPAANADTAGATLAALETEVNELKALLRTAGLMT